MNHGDGTCIETLSYGQFISNKQSLNLFIWGNEQKVSWFYHFTNVRVILFKQKIQEERKRREQEKRRQREEERRRRREREREKDREKEKDRSRDKDKERASSGDSSVKVFKMSYEIWKYMRSLETHFFLG